MTDKTTVLTKLLVVAAAALLPLAFIKWGLVPVVEAFGGPTLPVMPTFMTLLLAGAVTGAWNKSNNQ